ncbi:MAG: hypothetical protein ACJAU6_002500 [Alphaproteobacteria bacterium]|jgi:hypothetical protein
MEISMALSSLALCSRAMLKIGAGPISGFQEGTPETQVAATLYPSIRDGLLSAYPWSFATAQRRLARLVAQPIADFEYAYQLPGDFLRALSAGQSGRGRGVEYRISERRLHTNAEDVTLTYVFRSKESETPPFFDQALIALLAAEFTIPITESTSRAESLQRLADNAFRTARLVDSQQDQPARFEEFSLVDVRGQ